MAKETNFPEPPRGHVALLGWDSVNARWQAVAVDASGLVQIDVADIADRQVNAHGYDGSAWQKLPLLWGYTDRYTESIEHTKIGAASYNMWSSEVAAGVVRILNMSSSLDNTTAITHRHFLRDGTDNFQIETFAAQPINTWAVNPNVFYVLKEGDQQRIQFVSAADGDVLTGRWWGYEMAIS